MNDRKTPREVMWHDFGSALVGAVVAGVALLRNAETDKTLVRTCWESRCLKCGLRAFVPKEKGSILPRSQCPHCGTYQLGPVEGSP